jgi:hypothetical protein
MNIAAISATASYPIQAAAQKRTAVQGAATQASSVLPPLQLPSKAALTQESANFADNFNAQLQQAGIQVPPEVVLTSDVQGHIRVANNHPDSAKIEQIFNDNPSLQQSFAKISSWSSIQRAADHYPQFANDYASQQGNPAAINALVTSEVVRNQAPFFMAITGQGSETFFGTSPVTQA